MKKIERLFFGPASEIKIAGPTVIQDDMGSTPVYHYPIGKEQSLLVNTLSGFPEKDIHFLIRFLHVIGYADFPSIPVEKMDQFLVTLKSLLKAIDNLKDGFGMDDLPEILNLIRSLKDLAVK